jgi:hypothetical protein
MWGHDLSRLSDFSTATRKGPLEAPRVINVTAGLVAHRALITAGLGILGIHTGGSVAGSRRR